MEQWLEFSLHSEKVLPPSLGSFWSSQVVLVHARVFSRNSFIPLTNNMHIQFISNSKRSAGVGENLLSLCGSVMDWRPARGVVRLLHNGCLKALAPPQLGMKKRVQKEDGWMEICFNTHTSTMTQSSARIRVLAS